MNGFFVRAVLAAACLLRIAGAPPIAAQEAESIAGVSSPELLLILDASGSMWGQIEGTNKIVIARRALADLLAELPDGSPVGLIAYGHRREGDCADIEMVVPSGPLDRESMRGVVDDLDPKGKTPITAAIDMAVATIAEGGAPTTLILVSDGLETCGGDPCASVREAREAGVDFRLHVVGFGIEEGDVSQLECAAQAGGGLYLPAADAAQLADALGRAVAASAARDEPPATLSVRVIADGEPIDAMVAVVEPDGGADVVVGRTYTGAETNPRRLPVPPGTYDVVVRALGLEGEPVVRFDGLEIRGGELVERQADFSTGELAVEVTRNGALSDATVRITRAGEDERVTGGRTYTGATSNPAVYRLTPGDYSLAITALEIEGAPGYHWQEVTVTPGARASLAHDFASGELTVGVVDGDTLVDATLRVTRDGETVASGRTYTTSPKTFTLEPGTYSVRVQPLRHPDGAPRDLEVVVAAGATVERTVRLGEG